MSAEEVMAYLGFADIACFIECCELATNEEIELIIAMLQQLD